MRRVIYAGRITGNTHSGHPGSKSGKDGWRKQYRYYFGNRTIWLTAEAAEKKNLRRVDKQPRIKNIPNRTIAKWNSTETLESWRESWEELCNRYLKENGVDAQIDHRSYADQGIDRVPGVHSDRVPIIWKKKGKTYRAWKAE